MKKQKKVLIISIIAVVLLIIGLVVGYQHYNNSSYNELIKDVNIDELHEHQSEDVSVDPETGIKFLNNIIMIGFNWECSDKRKAEIINSIDGEVVGGMDGYNELHVKIKKSTLNELEKIIEELEKNDDVVYADYDEFHSMSIDVEGDISKLPLNSSNVSNIPNDSWDNNANWNDINMKYNNWWVVATQTHSAWKYNEYFNQINIGIVDFGFEETHEDLKGNIRVISKESSPNEHGTHVAGIIGATHNNDKIGLSGIVKNANMFAYDVYCDESKADVNEAEVYKGLEDLVQIHGCKVINFSLGLSIYKKDGKYYEELDPLKEIDVKKQSETASKRMGQLREKGYDFIVVQSAGNGEKNSKLGVDAVYNGFFASITEENCYSSKKVSKKDIMDRVIIVGASRKNSEAYQMTDFSNGGKGMVDIVAPGYEIYSTVLNNGYERNNGTSMASPIVTGVASLIWSVNEKFSGADIKDILCSTAKKGGILVSDNPNSETTGDFYMVNTKLAVEEAIKRFENSTVKGVVKNNNDEVVENADIGLICADGGKIERLNTKTDKNGFFSIVVPKGTYTAYISKKDHETKTINNVSVSKGETTDLGVIELTAKATDPKWLEPTKAEWEELEKYLTNITLDVYNGYSFDSSKENSCNSIYDMISTINIYESIYTYYFDKDYTKYTWNDNGEWDVAQNMHDPLNKLGGYYHYKIPAKNIDWIITNIFNAEPNHNFSDSRSYYYGDYFYMSGGDGGDYVPEQKISQKSKLSNGLYDINSSGEYYNSSTKMCYSLTAGIKEIDGKRYWSFTKLSYSETENSHSNITEEYLNILNNHQKSHSSDMYKQYSVYDIDKDKNPELIIRTGTCEADAVFKIYTYKQEKATYIGEIPSSRLSLSPINDENGVYLHFHSQGWEEISKLSIIDNKIVQKEISSGHSVDSYTDLGGYLKEVDISDYSLVKSISS